ncbi:MAG: bifunctional 4-hydroxy-3-methylbut-2-enyl diphosphate reductase/30S ribosomal protein S1 [Oscillospiraceae bacterium]|nr:bifunctional 4-hydroxy-3-methylbut-2-enyl diphosphate reductase/30S ribosomal protein S1 [Oscillospiraceae bacterium]
MRELRVAESAGFCFGVQRSVEMAEEMLRQGPCASFGMLIHNTDVVERLSQQGMRIVSDVDEVKDRERVLIRAHGVPPETLRSLEAHGAAIRDATCPKVMHIHRIVEKASSAGRFVVIIGMKQHPEVEAISARCAEHVILEDAEETASWISSHPEVWEIPITVVVQTTQTKNNFDKCVKEIKKRCTNAEISDTICFATSTRQEEAAALSQVCDAMIVIGGRHSANSLHLAEICRQSCENVQFIEKPEELDFSEIKKSPVVGLTAGASTPAWIIKEVRNKMSDEIRVEEVQEEAAVAEAPAVEAVEAPAAEAAEAPAVEAPAVEKELSFDEMLEETLKTIYNGEKVSGTVVSITGTEVSVDLGAKYSGFIPTTEFTESGVKVEDAVKVGDTIEAIVVRVNDVEGTAMLSKRRLDAAKAWNDVEAAVENNDILEGVVTEENKGGVVVTVNGIRVFVPASQTDLPREAELSQLLHKTVRLRITEVNRARKRVVGSIRRVAQAERRERVEKLWNEMEVGKKYHGVVKSLTSYGAFVDIGGVDGMVHVSELSWGRIHQPSEVVSVGDEIDVYVINFDREKRKISLGYKDPNANPWVMFTNRYAVGDTAEVKIVKLMTFGAFAEVLPGVDGLIHISQIADHRIEKPEDVLRVGDVVEAKITAVDEEKHKISLSIRALLNEAKAAQVQESEEVFDEEAGDDALVYEVSADGEATGNAADFAAEEE